MLTLESVQEMAQWQQVPAAKPDSVSSIPRAHRVEEVSWLLRAVLPHPHMHHIILI